MDNKGNKIKTNDFEDFPQGLASVKFTLTSTDKKEDEILEFVSGFVGVTFDKETFSVMPVIRWYVREPLNVEDVDFKQSPSYCCFFCS